mgnify:CR=1 FL=1
MRRLFMARWAAPHRLDKKRIQISCKNMGVLKIGESECYSCVVLGALAAKMDAKNQRTEDESGIDIAAV